MIGGLKYAKEAAQIAHDDSGPLEQDFIRHIHPFGYGSDKFQVGYIMYCLLREQIIENPVGDPFLQLEFPGVDRYNYKQLMLKHITQMIWDNYDMRVPDILKHPFFMSTIELVGFEDRLRTFSCQNYEMDDHMELLREEVFTGKWTDNLSPPVIRACNYRIRVNSRTFVGLWQARRNRRQHRDEDEYDVRTEMGPMHVANFLFWEEKFPAFFMHLWQRLLCYYQELAPGIVGNLRVFELPEFKNSEFFPATVDFYEHAINTPIR